MSLTSEEKLKALYEGEADYLRANPEEIHDAWNTPSAKRGGILFGYIATDRFDNNYSCATQIRGSDGIGGQVAQTIELTREIATNNDIPSHPSDIASSNLAAFVAVQLHVDAVLGRTFNDVTDEDLYKNIIMNFYPELLED